jgi:transcriptional regulator with GAF, ATPase, and Fis domain
VRELHSAVQRAAILASAEGAKAIEAGHVFPPASHSGGSGQSPQTFHEQTRRFQAGLVQRTLEAAGWNVTAAARTLDLTRAHLHNLIKTFGLSRSRDT